MNRLVTRLVLSHLAVAVLGASTTFVLVRSLAPQLFDQQMHGGPMGGGQGQGPGQGRLLRDQFAAAIDGALGVGVVVGLLAAAVLGILAAFRLTRPLATLGAATRAIAQGRYAEPVPAPGTVELGGLAADIRTLGRTLGETEARRTRLLGEVAHEMRTPLTVLDGHLEGMIDGVLPATPEAFAGLQAETRRLRRLSDDLSALSRAEEGRLALVPRPIDLTAVVRGAVERLRPQAEDAGVALHVPSGTPVPCTADPDRVAQVVTNLVGNALRATPADGTVSVSVSGDPEGGAEVTVSDTGEGLAADELERIFERFHRVPGRRSGGAGAASGDSGSGIGLTISRGIARAHGGELTAASEGLGRGATFTLRLPHAGPPPPTP